MRRLMLAVTVVLGAACGGAEPIGSAKLQAEVRERFDAWVKAFNWANPDSLADFYLKTGYLSVGWPNGQRTRGWEQEAQFQKNFLPTIETMNLVPRDPAIVVVRRNLALVSFPFSLALTAGGVVQSGPGQGMVLWQMAGGRWRIYAAQISYTKAIEGAAGSPRARR